MRTVSVHGLPAMTLVELADINCGHCRHQLTYHITSESGVSQCAICHCLRSPGEDIRKPHNFSGGAA